VALLPDWPPTPLLPEPPHPISPDWATASSTAAEAIELRMRILRRRDQRIIAARAMGSRDSRSSALIVWRTLVLLAVAGVALVALLAGREPAIVYSCSMHPNVRSSAPGRCPFCSMALETLTDTLPPASRAPGPPIAASDLYVVQRHTFSQPVRAPARAARDGTVAALFYKDELASLAPAARAAFVPTASPAASFSVRRTADPPRPWDDGMTEVRFRFEAEGDARPDDVGRIVLPPTAPVLVVPEDVVFSAAGGRYVLVASADGQSFSRRTVEIGRLINGRAVVLDGLGEGERIARRGAFLLDADQRLRDTAAPGAAR